jgi:hypothetical protein
MSETDPFAAPDETPVAKKKSIDEKKTDDASVETEKAAQDVNEASDVEVEQGEEHEGEVQKVDEDDVHGESL